MTPPVTEQCEKKKCGEYNMLECCREAGHEGEHNYVVVTNPTHDYPHNQKRKRAKP